MGRNPLLIGDFLSKPSISNSILIQEATQLEDVRLGDVISPLGDYLMEWDKDCLPPSELERWRFEGDPRCDEVVRVLGLRPGQDGLQVLLDRLGGDDVPECLKVYWEEISNLPPNTIAAPPPYLPTPHPTYNPAPTLSEGQSVFWRYSSQIFSALLHFSLAGGFSANRVVNVLRETNYLTGKQRDASYKRLLETTQAVMDYMTDMTPITGIGWKSAVRVRMLHSTVRTRLLDKKGIYNVYDDKVDGIPINQEDLIATLGSFAIAPLWALRRNGIRLSREEELAYLAVWRHIGFYLGISPSRLEKYYASVSTASKLFACNTMHLFNTTLSPTSPTSTNTYRLLSSVADRPPRHTPISHHLATSRYLLGDGLADRLLLPRTPWEVWVKVKLGIYVERSLVAFGRVWRVGWEVERVRCTRLLIGMIVVWQLGGKRTKFTMKSFMGDEGLGVPLVVGVKGGDEGSGVKGNGGREGWKEKGGGVSGGRNGRHVEEGEREKGGVGAGADPDDDVLDGEVELGQVAAKRVIARWRWLLAEMAGVVLGVVGLPILGVGLWYRSTL